MGQLVWNEQDRAWLLEAVKGRLGLGGWLTQLPSRWAPPPGGHLLQVSTALHESEGAVNTPGRSPSRTVILGTHNYKTVVKAVQPPSCVALGTE